MDIERKKLGLDQPLWKQFTTWMAGLAAPRLRRCRCGPARRSPRRSSCASRCRCSSRSWRARSRTLLAIPLGILAAVKQDTWVDYAVRVFSIAGLATPSFWLGILMILTMLIVFKWVPPMVFTPLWVDPWENLAQLIWPALAVGYRYSRGRHAHDALGDARGAARGLHPHRARQGAVAEADPHAPRAEERDPAGAHRHQPGVRVPARRPGGDRAGVQPERPGHAVRRGDRAPRLHAHPGAGDAGRDRLPVRQLRVDIAYAWLDPRIRYR